MPPEHPNVLQAFLIIHGWLSPRPFLSFISIVSTWEPRFQYLLNHTVKEKICAI